MRDFCLNGGKFEVLKMLDLQTKSAINLDSLQVQHWQEVEHFQISFLIILIFQNLTSAITFGNDVITVWNQQWNWFEGGNQFRQEVKYFQQYISDAK